MIHAARGRGVLLPCLVAAITAGCLAPSSVTCSDGRICPAGTGCDVVNHRCVTAAELTACNGLAEAAACSLSGAPGICRGGVCNPFFCGDGLVTGLEMCDGAPPQGMSCLTLGFDRGLLGCSDTCLPAPEGCGYFGWPVVAEDMHWWVTGLWGSGPRDVFAVGHDYAKAGLAPLILHWDGSRWSPMTAPALDNTFLEGVWGAGPDDVVAVGSGGTIFHWDGENWSKAAAPTSVNLQAVWGSGPDDVFAVGYAGTILHWDGGDWQPQTSGTDAPLSGVWGSGRNDVFAVGGMGTILHWDGTAWTPMATDAPATLSDVWGRGPNDVFAVGAKGSQGLLLHWDGAAWTALATPPTIWLSTVWGSGPDDLVVGGVLTEASHGGAFLRRTGSDWTVLHGETPFSLTAIWGSGPDDIFAGGGDRIAHGPGTTESVAAEQTLGIRLSDVGGNDRFEDVFAVGSDPSGRGAVARWTGGAWSVEIPTSPPLPPLARIWAANPADLFVLAASPEHVETFRIGPILRGSGSSWAAIGDPPVPLRAIWGTGADNVFAAGDRGTILRWDGARWQTSLSDPLVTTATILGLWGSGPRDVFAVGEAGTILHWDGTRWTKMDAAIEYSLSDVWGTGPNDVSAVGDPGVMVHWDGTRWSWVVWTGRDWRMPAGGTVTGEGPGGPPPLSPPGWLRAVGGSGPGDRFTCGGEALFHAYRGTWEPIVLPPFVPLDPGGVFCTRLHVTPRRVFVVGDGGALVVDRPTVTCAGPETFCNDGWDNDCDGLADSADSDCADKTAEQCANYGDDDGDGAADCADPDCAAFPSCR